MNIKEEFKIEKTSNYPAQKVLSELELLAHFERHYAGNPAARIYVAPRCYIRPEFYPQALTGMLESFSQREEYETCTRIYNLIQSVKEKHKP